MPLVIDIFDTIGADFFGEGVTAKSVAMALASDPEADSITVRIDSPGGSVFEGHAIFNLLRGADAPVNVEIIGLAASMASIIALAGDTVSMADNALYMVHNPFGMAVGDADEMRSTADLLDKVKSTLVNIYAKRSGKTKGQVSKLMNAETWLTAKEAKAEGFIDTVADSFGDKKEASAEAKGRIFATLSQFINPPAQLLRSYESRMGQELVAAHSKGAPRQDPPQPKATTMDRAQILALLGLSADASDDTIRAKAQSLLSPSLDNMVPRADLDAANEKLVKAQSELACHAKAEEDRFEKEVSDFVDAACAAGKIPPSSKDYHLSNAKRDRASFEGFKSYIGAAPVIVSNSQMQGAEKKNEDATAVDSSTLTETELKLCARMGLDPKEFIEQKKADAKNPAAAMYGSHVG